MIGGGVLPPNKGICAVGGRAEQTTALPVPVTDVDVSISLPSGRTALDVETGSKTACVLLDNASIVCMGGNELGDLGIGTTSTTYTSTWSYISSQQQFKSISSSTNAKRTCAISVQNELYCWGQKGTGSSPSYDSIPTKYTPPIHYNSLLEGTAYGQLNIENSNGQVINLSNYNISGNLPQGLTFAQDGTINGSPNYTTDNKNWTVTISNATHHWNFSLELEIIQDTDYDLVPNSEDTDDDNDGVPDTLDSCPIQAGNSTADQRGCLDTDGDGYSNLGDPFPNDKTQWSDQDGDRYGDNASGTRADDCPNAYGDSRKNGTFGCPDADGDGWADSQDAFDADSSQWNDSDGDGYGDEFSGFQGDGCKNTAGNSTIDRYGCVDTDGDGYSDFGDAFDNNPTQWIDSDGDGYGNNQSANATQSDAFPSDGTQWNDADGDGHW